MPFRQCLGAKKREIFKVALEKNEKIERKNKKTVDKHEQVLYNTFVFESIIFGR